MRTIRFIGACLIILASGAAGILMARSYMERPKNLRFIQTALQALETEIHYSRTSLPEACMRIAKHSKHPINTFFHVFGENLQSGDGLSAKEAWDKALEVLRDAGFIRDDVERISTLGNALGRSDAEDQVKHLVLLQKQLAELIARSEEEKDQNVLLWNCLGFCVGALVVILLF